MAGMGKALKRAPLVGLLLGMPAVAATEQEPAALQQLRQMGVQFAGTFEAKGGLTAWAGYHGDQPLAVYEAPDGEHIILGRILDASGENVNQAALEQRVNSEMAADVMQRLERSTWIADGADDADTVAYVFTDLNCPYCNKLWVDARPWVESGRLQLRHVLVGILRDNSAAKAATLLTSDNPHQQLAEHARLHMQRLGNGPMRPVGDGGVAALRRIQPAIQAQLDGNHALMGELGLRATPALVWLDADGRLHKQTGAPEALLTRIGGPLK